MVKASEFRTVEVQATIFTPNQAEFKASQVLVTILGKYAKRYDGDVQSLPLPGDIPAKVPRIVLKSSDNVWTLNASVSSISSVWQATHDAQVPGRDVMVDRCSEVLRHYAQETSVRVGRIALVLKHVRKTENPGQVLIDRFCNTESKDPDSESAPLRRSRDFQLHNHKQYESPIPGLKINSWVRCMTGTLTEDESPVIVVMQDLNTLDEELGTRAFTADEMASYYTMATKEADDILNLYFPD